MFAGFADFAFYRMELKAAHLVAGFGRIVDLKPQDILTDTADAAELVAAEPDILAHMNDDHADAVRLYATKLLGAPDGEWRCVGCDPEGLELQHGRTALRLPFRQRVRARPACCARCSSRWRTRHAPRDRSALRIAATRRAGTDDCCDGAELFETGSIICRQSLDLGLGKPRGDDPHASINVVASLARGIKLQLQRRCIPDACSARIGVSIGPPEPGRWHDAQGGILRRDRQARPGCTIAGGAFRERRQDSDCACGWAA